MDKLPVEVAKAKEGLDASNGSRCLLVLDDRDLLRIYLDTVS